MKLATRIGSALAALLLPTAASAETAPLAPIIEMPQWMQMLADDLFVPGCEFSAD